MSLAPARRLTPVPTVLQHRTVATVQAGTDRPAVRVLQPNRTQAQLSLFDRAPRR